MFRRSYRYKGWILPFLKSKNSVTEYHQALETASLHGSEYQKLVVATSGVVFLGSPLQGTRAGRVAQWRAMLAGILNQNPSQTLLQDLNGNTKILRETSKRFVKIIRAPPMQTMIKCYWESQKTQVLKAVLPTWVEALLAATKSIVRYLILNSEHS